MTDFDRARMRLGRSRPLFALAVAALVSIVTATSRAPRPMREARSAEESSLRLRHGIVGGFIPAILRSEIRVGYDRNRRVFRVVVQELDENDHSSRPLAYVERTAELSRETFLELLDGVLERGLAALPLEKPAGGWDIYGRDKGLELHHRDVDWHNRGPGGCVHESSSVEPTAEERAKFDALVAWIEGRVGALELRTASAVEALSVPPGVERESLSAWRAALACAEQQPFAAELDRNRATLDAGKGALHVRFPRASSQPLLHLCQPTFAWEVRIDAHSCAVVATSVFEPRASQAEFARRQFVQENPGLAPTTRDALLTGWVEPGMTREMVLAAWGEPQSKGVDSFTYRRDGCTVELRFQDGLLLQP